MTRTSDIIKRAIDAAFALIGLILASPLFVAIAAAVRLTSPGPVFFRHSRVGIEGRVFQMVKFRSMYANSADIRNPDGSAWSGKHDPRVTPIGHFLRSTSLDELPQLLNVLRGDMSLVGPRPDQPDQIRHYSGPDKLKLLVKPGLTGLAQLNGRNSIPWERRRELDIEYVQRRSLKLDLTIILHTVPYVLKRQNIYVD